MYVSWTTQCMIEFAAAVTVSLWDGPDNGSLPLCLLVFLMDTDIEYRFVA